MPTKEQIKEKEIRFALAIRAGKNIKEACETVGASRQWYYARKRANPDFKAEIDELLSRPKSKRDFLSKEIDTLDWQDTFIDLFIETGGVIKEAAKGVGKRVVEVYAYLNPSHPLYNKTFADAVAKAEVMVVQTLLDTARERAMDKDNQMLVQCLKWLDPERFGDSKVSNRLPYKIDVRVSSEDFIREKFNDFIDAEVTREQIPDTTG